MNDTGSIHHHKVEQDVFIIYANVENEWKSLELH